MNTDRCDRRGCRADIFWVHSAATGRPVPLDADPVEVGTKGALILIGDIAFSFAPAVSRLADLFGVPETVAYSKAHTDYGWHMPHPATCKARTRTRERTSA